MKKPLRFESPRGWFFLSIKNDFFIFHICLGRLTITLEPKR